MIRRTDSRMGLCSAFLVLNLMFIWGNSLLPAWVSGAFSQWVRDLIGWLLPGGQGGGQGDGLLRKLAHFTEFCSLGMLLSCLTGMNTQNLWKSVTLSLACGLIAACADEALQHLAPGRAPRFADVMIDTAGVAVGVILLWTGYKIRQKKKK